MTSSDGILQTILFADIAGSTRLFGRLGNQPALALVSACMNLLRRVALAHSGQTVKTIGDESMCVFAQPQDAARAAVAMQEAVAGDPELANHGIRLRIGFHHGPIIPRPGDFFGDGVNVAARMVAQAKAGQIITDRATRDQIDAEQQVLTRLVDRTRVRGKDALFELFEVTWGHLEELTLIGGNADPSCAPTTARRLEMTCSHQGRIVRIDFQEPVLTIGRDTANRLMIQAPMVSRLHARIELRRDTFILVDQSINGTFIFPRNAKMIVLRRAEIALPDSGYISVGQQTGPDSPLALHFQCS